MLLDDILTGECWLLFPGVDCAPGHFSIVKWLLGAGGGPTPPGFPAKVQSVFFISFSFFVKADGKGVGRSLLESLQKCWRRLMVVFPFLPGKGLPIYCCLLSVSFFPYCSGFCRWPL